MGSYHRDDNWWFENWDLIIFVPLLLAFIALWVLAIFTASDKITSFAIFTTVLTIVSGGTCWYRRG